MERQRSAATHSISPSTSIPDGFVWTVCPDGEERIVLEYLIPATHQAFDGYRKQSELDVRNESGGISIYLVLYIVFSSIPGVISRCQCRCRSQCYTDPDADTALLNFLLNVY